MVAAPQYGQYLFRGLRSGKTYTVDAYHSDVAAALVRFDAGAGSSSSSPTEWVAPEDVILEDYSIVTGMTDTTKAQLQRNNNPTGDVLRYSLHLTTLALRPRIRIGFRIGQNFRATQLA